MSGPIKIIACAVVAEELRELRVAEEDIITLEFGLHVNPEELKKTLQREIDSVTGECDILLGYGLCSNAAVGLKSDTRRLVIPGVDDCIALFLGSKAEHVRRLAEEPGTYFLTKGWVEAADLPLNEYLALVEKYGEKRATRVTKVMYANYTRVALINTGNYCIEHCRDFAKMMAEFLELGFEEIPGSNRLLEKMLAGDWDNEFIVIPPGEEITLDHFYPQV